MHTLISRRAGLRRAAALAALVTLPLAACTTTDDTPARQNNSTVATDVGVTDDVITIGSLTDLSSPFKAQGLATSAGNDLWASDVNSAGGICGRNVQIVSQDHGYKPDTALSLYEGMKGDVLGFVQVFGTPTFMAVKPKLEADGVLAIPSSLSSSLLDQPQVLMIGTTYDVEMINALGWLQSKGAFAEGATIGHIYIDSDYGQNAKLGVDAYAKEHNLTVESAAISATDTDMTATVTAMKAAGVQTIALSVTPAATASVLLQMQAQGLGASVIGNTPSWDPSLLSNPAGTFNSFYRVTAQAPFAYTESPAATRVGAEYKATFPDAPIDTVNYGYASAQVFGEVIAQACEAGDLTRAGMLKAAEGLQVDLGGLTPALDYSTPGAPPTREVFVEQVDTSVDGGLKVIEAGYVADEAKSYKAPHEA